MMNIFKLIPYPKDPNYCQSLLKMDEFAENIINAYKNLVKIVFGDFNSRIGNNFSGFKKPFPDWTF